VLHFAPAIIDQCCGLLADIHQKLSKKAYINRYARHDEVIVIEGGLLQATRSRLKAADPSDAPFLTVQEFFIRQVRECIALNDKVPGFEQQLFASLSPDSQKLLQQPLAAPAKEKQSSN